MEGPIAMISATTGMVTIMEEEKADIVNSRVVVICLLHIISAASPY